MYNKYVYVTKMNFFPDKDTGQISFLGRMELENNNIQLFCEKYYSIHINDTLIIDYQKYKVFQCEVINNELILTPKGPNAGPSGGPGLACPASINASMVLVKIFT